jgi:probable F420-dependent oxidoreductase
MRFVPPEQRPFRFGLMIETRGTTREGVIELARRAESHGFAVLLGSDHIGRWAALPLLQAAAEATGLRIGSFVVNNDLRHPVMLAQELASIDQVTGGRLEIGIGAGWNRPTYEAAGLAFDPPASRLRRLEASVRILKQAMTDGRIERQADDAYPAMRLEGMPRSLQRPHPPILVGGGGRRLLSFAAREADVVALNPRSRPGGGLDDRDVTVEAVNRKIRTVREAAGKRWSRLEINIIIFDVDPDHRRGKDPPPQRQHAIAEDELPLSPHYLVGDPGEMAERLIERRERWGISYVAFRLPHLAAVAPLVERLAGR